MSGGQFGFVWSAARTMHSHGGIELPWGYELYVWWTQRNQENFTLAFDLPHFFA